MHVYSVNTVRNFLRECVLRIARYEAKVVPL